MKNTMMRPKNSALAGLSIALALAIPCSADVLYVPADYSTIQAAVYAAASDDEIKIAAGVYTEQVLITNKNLTLTASPGAVLRATPGMGQTLTNYGIGNVALLGVAMSDVKVSGLTFEGERLADSQASWFDAIYYLGSSGSIVDCRVTGFRGSSLVTTNAPAPAGIFVNNRVSYGTGEVTIEVLRSTFADNGISIWLVGDSGDGFDPTVLRTNFKVNDNTIVGNGPDALGRQWGIYIWAGAGGEVKRNTITDHAYVGTTDRVPISFGINAIDNGDFARGALLASLQPIHFEGNILRNNQIDLLVVRGDGCTFVNNAFEGRAPGYRPVGLGFSGDNVLVGTNRFNDMETGIVLLGNDPDYGTYLGIASNATLVANGFCNVDTNIVVEQYATHTEQGTLICPPPRLEIRAVQLSWPYFYYGDSVETAPGANGLWTPSDATPFLQDGQNNLLMPMNSDQQFFRLSHP